MTRKALRSFVAVALLVGSAAAAYPWPAWLHASLMNGRVFGYYYYNVKYETLFSFGPHPGTGLYPVGGLVADKNQILGTTSQKGLAFALKPASPSGWNELPLASLPGGSQAPLTQISETQFAGTEAADVFLLTYVEGFYYKTIVYSFAPGTSPSSDITAGQGGTLYGTAQGGPSGNGFVYQLVPGQGGTYSESTLYAFKGGLGGSQPAGGVTPGPADCSMARQVLAAIRPARIVWAKAAAGSSTA